MAWTGLGVCFVLVIIYGKHSKVANTFLFLFSNKILVIRAGLVRKANEEVPDQTASSEAVCSGSAHFV